MYTKNELMFPYHVIPSLRDQRGPQWNQLVDDVLAVPEGHENSLAFCLMIIRLNGCMSCETDSYRAMKGCGICAQQILRRYKGTDQDLLGLYNNALDEVRRYLTKSDRAGSIKIEIAG